MVDPEEFDDLVSDPAYTDVKAYLERRVNRALRYDRGRSQRYLLEGNVNDSSGELNHGEVSGSENYTEGISPNSDAFDFDGTTQYVEMPNTLDEDFTIGMWVKTNASGISGDGNWRNGILLLDSQSDDDNLNFGISIVGNQAAFGVGETTIVGTTGITDDQWHFVTATRCVASGQMTLYVDGVQEAYAIGPVNELDNDAMLRMGQGESTENFVGQLDEVNLFNFTMSSADVRQLFGTTSIVSQPEEFVLVRGNVEAGALEDVNEVDQTALELKSRMHLGNRTFVDVEFEFDVLERDVTGLVLVLSHVRS